MSVTIKDLAKYCNVSVTTVSYSLNDSPEISNETKEKVKKAAIEIGYVPSAFARGLKRKKTCNIGIFIPGFDGPIHHTILSGIANIITSKTNQYNMIVTLADNEMNLVKERSVDLAIIMDSLIPNNTIIELSKVVPIIIFDKECIGDNIFMTSISNEQGMYEMTTLLVKKGCRNIAYMKGSSFSIHNKLRFDGYLKALKDNDIRINQDIIYDATEFTENKGYETMNYIINSVNNNLPFDALMCSNDELAIGAIRSLQEHNFNIPKDCKVSGFDNIDKDVLINPSLSTIKVDWYEYGQKMANLALDILDKNKSYNINIKTEVIERDSTK